MANSNPRILAKKIQIMFGADTLNTGHAQFLEKKSDGI